MALEKELDERTAWALRLQKELENQTERAVRAEGELHKYLHHPFRYAARLAVGVRNRMRKAAVASGRFIRIAIAGDILKKAAGARRA